jgi:hypothetical protein
MPKHRSLADQVGQLACFDPRTGLNPTRPASRIEDDQQMRLVLQEVRKSGPSGATRYELAETLWMLDNTVGPRLSDLRRYGLIRKTEALRKGAVVWLAV